MKKYSCLVLLIILFSGNLKSQVNIQDSLVLVDLYYSLNGPNWTSQNNWLTGPVRTWGGVGLNYPDSSRVTGIAIGGNNISGFIPNSIGDLSELSSLGIVGVNLMGSSIPYTIGRLKKCQYLFLYENQMSGQLTDSLGQMTMLEILDIWNNNFTGSVPQSLTTLNDFYFFQIQNNQFDVLPDFSQAPQSNYFFDIYPMNNRFTFEDFEPNMTLQSFNCSNCIQHYAPQFDSVNNTIDTTVQNNSVFMMYCTIGGQHNIYQWTKDTVVLPLATDSVLTINGAVPADSGVYACRVTNLVVPGLTYYRRPITVHVDKLTESLTDYAEPINVIRISPNPATNALNIESTTNFSQLLISDVLGNVVIRQQVFNHAVSVDVSGLGKGLYFVKLVGDKGFVVKKFLKE